MANTDTNLGKAVSLLRQEAAGNLPIVKPEEKSRPAENKVAVAEQPREKKVMRLHVAPPPDYQVKSGRGQSGKCIRDLVTLFKNGKSTQDEEGLQRVKLYAEKKPARKRAEKLAQLQEEVGRTYAEHQDFVAWVNKIVGQYQAPGVSRKN